MGGGAAGRGDADAAVAAGGQARAGEALPGGAAVFGAIQPAAGPSALQRPRLPPHLPQRGEDDLRILRIEGEIDGAGVLVLEEHALPGAAAVARAEYPALFTRPEGV